MIVLSDKDIKALRRVRSAYRDALQVLDSLPLDPAPANPRQRQNLKESREDQFDRNYSAGTWRKPAILKKKK
jgi:hypothetical protein